MWTIEPGEWFFVPEGEFWQDFDSDTHLLSLRFRATWLTGIPLFHHDEGVKLPAEDSPILESAALPLHDYFKQEFDVAGQRLREISATMGQYMKLQGLLMNWLERYVEALIRHGLEPTRINPLDPRMIQVARQLNNWPLNVQLDEDELATQQSLSNRQLSRLFQRDFSMTPSRYFSVRKLDSAKNALQARDATIKEIASSLGFKSLSHFSTWFRNQCGESPRNYRQTFHEYHPIQR